MTAELRSSKEGLLRISSDRDDQMGPNIKTPQKVPRASNKTLKKSLDQKLFPQKIPFRISKP